MPGFESDIPLPQHLEMNPIDADEILPNMLHPSYPFGRPISLGQKRGVLRGVGNLFMGLEGRGGFGSGSGGRGGRGGEEGWDEMGLEGFLGTVERKEVPPGMAVSDSVSARLSFVLAL